MTLLFAVLTTSTAWAATVQFPIYSGDEGTEAKPYQIKTTNDLIKFSDDVNSGTTYEGKYFKLMDNIDFSHSSTWSDITSEENNFTPIGTSSTNSFKGTFDGNERTISGIRIYKGTNNNSSQEVGLFGGLKGTVKKLTLTDTRIIGYSDVGGIVGYCSSKSTVDHCTVTSTVAIYAIQAQALRFGGIAGNAGSKTATITNNTSSATVAIKDGLGACEGYGGILGGANSEATVSNNLAIGAKVKDSSGNAGAIMGYSNHGAHFTNNYYINCTVNGTANALNVGCHAEDITENCAAVSLHTLTLNAPVTTTTAPSINIGGTDYYGHGTILALNNGHDPASIPTGYTYPYIVNGESVPTANNTLVMPAADITIGLDAELVVTPWTGSGTSADDPYVFIYTSQLDLLATNVNSGTTYENTYFQLGDDLKYSYTNDWDDATSMENNYTPIGKNDGTLPRFFLGHFDGNGHTISGIRIYKNEGNSNSDYFKGVFGYIGNGATVTGITLDDTRIAGGTNIAGIVGRNEGGTVSSCTVTNHVAIHIGVSPVSNACYGGIVGINVKGTVTGCTSSVQMSVATGGSGNYIGGIVGGNASQYEETPGTVTGNFVIGAVIPASTDERHAAIAVSYLDHYVTYANNYYNNCTVAGVANATNVGVATPINSDHATIADITENFGAVPVYPLTLADGITATGVSATYGDDSYVAEGTTITLSGGLHDVSAANEFAFYTVNGEEINGNSFTMPAETVTVGTGVLVFAEWTGGDGTESSPYLIGCCDHLRLLAQRVNTGAVDTDGQRYGDNTKWYKLVADLQFIYKGLGETESNFEAIGNSENHCEFNGHFLGQGHTISGIRIRQGNKGDQGLFGSAKNSVISGIILDDADITGKSNTGGIVGSNNGGTVTDCHVTCTVMIHATGTKNYNYGGIVGLNYGTISGSTSAATFILENDADCTDFGGIVGFNSLNGTLSDNMALGVHLPNLTLSLGAIFANFHVYGTLLRNYYSGCTKEGGGTVSGFGNGSDVTNNDGAVPGIALYDHSVFSGLNSKTLQTVNNVTSPRVALLGRTLYKDGDWNTLCLPFNVSSIGNSPLAGATVMELDVDKTYDGHKTGVDGNTLYLYFKQANSIEAGKPYIVKWTTLAEDITNPVFSSVTISSTKPTDVPFTGGKFCGTYDKLAWSAETPSVLLLGAGNALFWPDGKATSTLGACRAYFKLSDGTSARQFVLNFDDDYTTKIVDNKRETITNNQWYTLDGRKLDGKPTKKGLYIVNGRKVIIK